jgi:hypothetical protein
VLGQCQAQPLAEHGSPQSQILNLVETVGGGSFVSWSSLWSALACPSRSCDRPQSCVPAQITGVTTGETQNEQLLVWGAGAVRSQSHHFLSKQ